MTKITLLTWAAAAACAGFGIAGNAAWAQDAPPASSKKITYSPYPSKTFPNRVYFGDTHLHTSYSTDAGMIGNTLGPDEAYRFARGEEVKSSTGLPAKLARPLDFLVVADHSENLGLAPALVEGNPDLLKDPWGKMQADLVKKGDIASVSKAYDNWMIFLNKFEDPLKGQTALASTMWHRVTSAAEKYNEPGRFTAFIGFEWTSGPDGANLHRNVIFRDGKAKADQIVPITAFDTIDPEKLWLWMQDYEKKTSGKLLAISHGGNLSNGLMFDDVTLTTKKPLDRAYAEARMRWEPLHEVTQMKGDAETHPLLSTRDEFANFERWDRGSFGPVPKTPDMLPREYARESFKRGLAYEAKLGVNPFKFGIIGSTDSHNSLATTMEGPGLRPQAARFLLRACAGDPDTALDHLRRQGLRRQAAHRRAREHPGAGLHLADLVLAFVVSMFQGDHRWRRRGVAGALALAASGVALPCGFEDPGSVSVQRGMMNLAFPKSAYVRTAIWQAQLAGDLPRGEADRRDDLSPQARATVQRIEATLLVNKLAARLGAASVQAERPAVAIVLLGPMLWSRLEANGGAVQALVHVGGPEPGDVVLVTDTPALKAMVASGMRFEQALELGLMRLYGPAHKVDRAQAWLATDS